MTEYKSGPQHIKSINDRTVTGLFAIHGNVDSVGDVSHLGSFTKTIAEGARGARFLWNHDFMSPPVAAIKSLREIGRDELPESVLAQAPEASGGMEVVREYLDTPRGNEILAGIKAGAIAEMSYGYDPVKFDFAELAGKGMIRNLREVKLYDVSDVLFGANGLTLASKAFMPLEALLAQLQAHAAELKAGSRHSAKDTAMLNAIHKAAIELGCTECKGILEAAAESAEKGFDLSLTFARLELLGLSI